jgi:membrane protein DedA with SNARE-associated domain
MNEIIQFLIDHGYAFLFLWIFGEQMGIPLPAAPIFLAAGALAGEGRFDLAVSVAVAWGASLLSNFLWYWIGRKKGRGALALLCRISFKPDSCIRGTADLFARHGARSLLYAKFIPGLSSLSPPLAGIFRLSQRKFLLLNGIGTLGWILCYVGLGYGFSDEIERVTFYAERLGSYLGVALIAALGAVLLVKYSRRFWFYHRLRTPRISVEALMEKMQKGEPLAILDVRHPLEVRTEPLGIPGAIPIPLEELEARVAEIPRDREIILYCD